MAYKTYGKRVIDLLSASILAVTLFWLLVIILLLYLILLEFPVFFKQERVGKANSTFWMWKFRTLSHDDKTSAHQRSFVLGKLLRFASLDELPQLWNIFAGEMSLIGPRPLPVEYLPLYSAEQLRRHDVRPGITGWAQVNGRNSISWQKKFELDVFYVNHISFRLDLLILFKTVTLLLSLQKDVSLNEQKFTGN
jgi:undecaprenyl phosphate N,N'-diacetylbacillosamine 1-phosphate transferase